MLIHMKKLNDEQIKLIIKLYSEDNKTIKQLAVEFNCCHVTIYRVLKENGIKKSKEKIALLQGITVFTKEQQDNIIKLYTQDLFSTNQIAKLLDTHQRAIRRTLKNNGTELRKSHNRFKNLDGSEYESPKFGDKSPLWKGGRRISDDGYVYIIDPNRKCGQTKKRHIREHRYIMEQHINRKLNIDEHVHHINGIKDDNRIENLVIKKSTNHYGEVICPCCNHQFRIR